MITNTRDNGYVMMVTGTEWCWKKLATNQLLDGKSVFRYLPSIEASSEFCSSHSKASFITVVEPNATINSKKVQCMKFAAWSMRTAVARDVNASNQLWTTSPLNTNFDIAALLETALAET